MRTISHFVDGQSLSCPGARTSEVFDPTTGEVQGVVEHGDSDLVAEAVGIAKAAQPAWAAVPPQRRAQVMFRYKQIIEEHMDELIHLLTSEHGKLLSDSLGEMRRGLDVVEFVCGTPHLQKGEFTEGAGPGTNVFSMRQPLGVVAGVSPFNFSAMIPLWMMAPAVASGNAIIMKPSQHDPSVSTRLAELAIVAGVPKGIFNIVHGGKETVEALADHPDIKAISLVGSTTVAKSVYGRGAANGKRMQAMGGAKNHGIILPDADLDEVVADVLSLAYGSAGERCMALPVIVPVGKETADAVRERLVEGIAKLRVGPGTTEGVHMGPVINAEHKARVERYIQMAIDEGAEVVVDGRGRTLEGHENGFFLWPTLIDHATPAMQSYQDEIFGPVLQIVRAETLDEAIGYPSNHHQGNGVAIFTRDGEAAQRFASEVEVGMVGINVPSPVPVSYHSFGGWKDSAFGDLNQYGLDSIRFFTRTKTITQRWPHGFTTTSK